MYFFYSFLFVWFHIVHETVYLYLYCVRYRRIVRAYLNNRTGGLQITTVDILSCVLLFRRDLFE